MPSGSLRFKIKAFGRLSIKNTPFGGSSVENGDPSNTSLKIEYF